MKIEETVMKGSENSGGSDKAPGCPAEETSFLHSGPSAVFLPSDADGFHSSRKSLVGFRTNDSDPVVSGQTTGKDNNFWTEQTKFLNAGFGAFTMDAPEPFEYISSNYDAEREPMLLSSSALRSESVIIKDRRH